MKKNPYPKVRENAGLIWATFFILLFGGVLTYIFSLDKVDPSNRMAMHVTILATVISAGICLISASARWWLFR